MALPLLSCAQQTGNVLVHQRHLGNGHLISHYHAHVIRRCSARRRQLLPALVS